MVARVAGPGYALQEQEVEGMMVAWMIDVIDQDVQWEQV